MLYFNFLAPLLMILLMLTPLVKPILVPDYISSQTYQIIKIIFSFFVCAARGLTFRKELQFVLSESYILIQKLMVDKNEKLFKYI